MGNGLFIALEGPDGSGKSTIAKKLKEHLENKGHKVYLTREPGGTDIGEDIRSILLDNENTEMAGRTEALLYAAARAQHVDEVINPLLTENYIVISDRYIYSSLAYQGHSRSLGIQNVMDVNNFGMNNRMADKTLFFEIDPKVALSRKFIGREADRLENEGNSFHMKTYEGYEKALYMYDEDVSRIDANGTVDETLKQCLDVIEKEIQIVKDNT